MYYCLRSTSSLWVSGIKSKQGSKSLNDVIVCVGSMKRLQGDEY